MILTEQEAEIILSNPKNLVNKFEKSTSTSNIEIKQIKHGRDSRPNLTEAERVLVGTIARAGLGSVQSVADEFNLSHEAVENYKKGRVTRTSDQSYKRHPELEEKIQTNLDVVQERAVDVLLRSLGVITDDKLAKVSAKDASSIAANASKIVQNCAPQTMNDNRIQVVMYAPKQKTLDDFNVVDI